MEGSMTASRLIGIDFGTKKTVCAAWRDGQLRSLPGQREEPSTPSCVLISRSGTTLVGWDALHASGRFGDGYASISSVKRRIGRAGEASWSWWKGYPQLVTAYILATAKHCAERGLGEPVEGAVIAIPAHFDAIQRRATIEAAEIAGLQAVRLLNEATAAAIAYDYHEGSGADRRVLVFDFGGGTLDVAIVDCGDGVYDVVTTEGDGSLGGDDFDRLVARDIARRQAAKFEGCSPVLGSGSSAELLEIAEDIKRELSSRPQAVRRMPGFVRVGQDHHDLDYELKRSEFEALASALLARARDVLTAALRGRERTVTAVVLMGGTSRMPCVQQMVKAVAGSAVVSGGADWVAHGAALYAAALQGDRRAGVLLDVTPSTLSVGLAGGVVSPLIEKATTIPTMKVKTFTTTEDNQMAVDITVYTGEKKTADENQLLGRVKLSVPPAPLGVPHIEVTFSIDADGTLSVSAKDRATERRTEATIDSPYALNSVQLRKLGKEIKEWLWSQRGSELSERIDRLLNEYGHMPGPYADEMRRAREALKGAAPLEVVEKLEPRVNQLQRMVERASSLLVGISSLRAAWNREWGCSPTRISQGLTLVQEQLEIGTLSESLLAAIENDVEVHQQWLHEGIRLKEEEARLLALEPQDQLRDLARESRQWHATSNTISPVSADEVRPIILRGRRAVSRALARVFVRGDAAVRARVLAKLPHDVRASGPRIARMALALLRKGAVEERWRSLDVLNTLVGSVEWAPPTEYVGLVFDCILQHKAWGMRDLSKACVRKLEPRLLADLCAVSSETRTLLLKDQACLEQRERVAQELEDYVAKGVATKRHLEALDAVSHGDDPLARLLETDLTVGIRRDLYSLLREVPRQTAVGRLLARFPGEVEDLRRPLLDCLREHATHMTAHERQLLGLAEQWFQGTHLRMRDRVGLWRSRSVAPQYRELAAFLRRRRIREGSSCNLTSSG